jgi:hypothetical protein
MTEEKKNANMELQIGFIENNYKMFYLVHNNKQVCKQVQI